VPKWLLTGEDQEEMARRRLLMVLSVISGERPVTEAIEEAAISRGTYYQMEEKALRAMLVALSPAAGPEGAEESALEVAKGEIQTLQERVKKLEREKRRTERLLYVTRKVVKPGPVAMRDGRGRKRGAKRGSTRNGNAPSTSSPEPTSPIEAAVKGAPSAAGGSSASH
jgi:hypothetical protein